MAHLIRKSDLRVDALFDIQAFTDLIKYQEDGMSGFSDCHKRLFDFSTINQRVKISTPETRRDIVLFPREHRKSTIRTVIRPMWRIYRNPNIRMLIGCNDTELSKAFIREIKQYFEDEELQDTVWNNRPHIPGALIPALSASSRRARRSTRELNDAVDQKVVWNAYQLQVIRDKKFKEPTIEAYSVGTTPTGFHYDDLTLDDIVDFNNSRTEAKAKKIMRWANDLENVVTKKTRQVQLWDEYPELIDWVGDEIHITGTRYYEWDYYSKFVGNEDSVQTMRDVLKSKNYSGLVENIYVNGVDNSDGYIFPEEFDAEIEKNLRDRLESWEFAAQYLLKIVAQEESKFDINRIKFLAQYQITNVKDLPVAQYRHSLETQETSAILLHAYLDTAISKRETADRTAIGIGGFDENLNFYLLDLDAGRWDASEIVHNTYKLLDKWGLNALIYETGVGLSDAIGDMFRYQMQIKKRRHITLIKDVPSRLVSKEDEIEFRILPVINSDMFYTFKYLLDNTPLGHEMKYFLAGGHDDCLDIVKGLIKFAKRTGKGADRRQSNKIISITPNTYYGGVRV